MKTFAIKLPLSECSKDLNQLQKLLKKYSGKNVVDNQGTTQQVLRELHIGIVDSYRIGWCPLVLHFSGESRDYISRVFAEMKVSVDKNKIICEVRVATDEEYKQEKVLVKDGELSYKYEFTFS